MPISLLTERSSGRPCKSLQQSTSKTATSAMKKSVPHRKALPPKTNSAYQRYRSLIGRAFVTMYFGIFLVWSFSLSKPNYWAYFAYLTYWGWILEFAYFVFSLVLDIYTHLSKTAVTRVVMEEQQKNLRRKLTQQMLAELVFVVQIVIVLFYWTVVFPQSDVNLSDLWWDLQFHGVGLLFILLDYAYRKIYGFSLRNHKYIISFGVTYLTCHIAVVLYSGQPIYPGVHFRDARSFIITLAALSTMVFTHKIVYLYVHWNRIKDECQSIFSIIKIIIIRSDSFDTNPVHFLLHKLTHIQFKGLKSRTASQASFMFAERKDAKTCTKSPKQTVVVQSLKRYASF
ncbi:hypothetical protein IE077_001091 [Cardiosporidium cionae]|uniref:Transmembrane protein n=1 Tax=Cardiosporidium cionae TaxID=476202 RepID=A0ABQ7J5U7_9APIC|nr:hypothetical protein IE077_001091 [Cardiosporidium cionae]|eukprot:KAF8819380.1 hypothetical protein IE077_001091 [Cardiosporidium cionae]